PDNATNSTAGAQCPDDVAALVDEHHGKPREPKNAAYEKNLTNPARHTLHYLGSLDCTRAFTSSQELPTSGDRSYSASAASSACFSAADSSPRSCQASPANSSSLACTSARSSGLRRVSSAMISAF